MLNNESRPVIIGIDFDGTIVKRAFPKIGKLRPLAKEAIRSLKEKGYIIIIWSCRSGIFQLEAEAFLREQGIPFDFFNENTPEIKEALEDPRKIFADYYFDDQNWPPFPGWEFVLSFFESSMFEKNYSRFYQEFLKGLKF